jgi:Holliday junction resolvasome RuvABC ATP-dependent DNA helicase subunit
VGAYNNFLCKTILIREKDKPWFRNEIRKEIRIRDRIRKELLKYQKQRNKVNNMKKIAKEKFENNLDNFLLNNSSNPKMYWKIMKMLIKSNKGNYCI